MLRPRWLRYWQLLGLRALEAEPGDRLTTGTGEVDLMKPTADNKFRIGLSVAAVLVAVFALAVMFDQFSGGDAQGVSAEDDPDQVDGEVDGSEERPLLAVTGSDEPADAETTPDADSTPAADEAETAEGEEHADSTGQQAQASPVDLNEAQNLELVRSSAIRNRADDQSPWAGVPTSQLSYDEATEPGEMPPGRTGAGIFHENCNFSHFAYDDAPSPVPTKSAMRVLGLPVGSCRLPMGPDPDDIDERSKAVLAALEQEGA